MTTDKHSRLVDYATALLKFDPNDERAPAFPESAPPSEKRRGRKEVLTNAMLGAFFKAIAEINSANAHYHTDLSIAGKLKERQEYCHLGVRHLRRNVAYAIRMLAHVFEKCPPEYWEELIGVCPPAAMTHKLLRGKVFELLRHQLSQQQLMAKKQELMATEKRPST